MVTIGKRVLGHYWTHYTEKNTVGMVNKPKSARQQWRVSNGFYAITQR